MKTFSFPARSFRNRDGLQHRISAVDCNFRASTFGFYGGHCAGAPNRSFRDISRDYFQNEARYSFIGEAAVFILIVATAALAIGIGAFAAIDFMRVLGYF